MADMNTLITAFQNARKAGDEAAATRLAQAIKSMQQQQQGSQDGAFAYGVDKAQQMAGKGIEVLGDLVGSDSVKDFGSDIVAQQEKDIKAGGYQPTFTGSLTDNYKQGGLDAAIGWLVEKTAENAASGGFAIAGTGLSAAVALFNAPVALAIGAGTLVTSGVMGAGETALEMEDKTGKYDPKVAAGVGVLVGILDKFGAGKVIPTDKLATMTGKELVGELMDKGFVDAATAVGGRISKSTITEGATETAQEGAIMAGTAATGGKYTGGEIVDRSIDAFALGGTMGGGTTTAIETGKGVVNAGKATTRLFAPGDTSPSDPEAAADLAQRLNTIAVENDYDLNDIDKTSTKGARETVDKAHVQLSEELKQVAKDLKNRLNITDTDELSVVLNKVMASAGQREARNKTKNTVGKQEMDAVQDLTGDTAEGQRMMSIMRQLNELTEIHNSGYQGGVSKITDQFAPFGTNIGYDRGAIATERLLRPLVSGGAAVQTGGASLLGQAAIAGAGRAIDSMTGRRSRVRRYIKQNKNELGIEQGNEPSLRQAGIDEANQLEQERIAAEQQGQLEQQQREQLDLELAQRNAPPTPGSPQDTMEDGTGLDRNGVARILRILDRIAPNPILKKAIESYRNTVARGGRVNDLSRLIRAVNAMADANPDLDALRVREPNRNREIQQTQLDARIEQGKRDNQATNDQLSKALNEDKTVDPQTKAIGLSTLAKLRLDLGRTPLTTAQSYVDDANKRAKNPQAIQTYVQPYVDRVAQQQQIETQNDTIVNDQAPLEMGNAFEGVNDPMRVSTRVPSAQAATEDAITEDLSVDMNAIRSAPGNLLKRMLKKLNAYEGAKGFRRDNKGNPADQQFKDFVKSNLLYLYNSVTPEYRARAKQWYVGANKLSQEAADTYGLSLPQVAGVMAALSPQQDWYMNYDIGIRVLDTYLNRQDEIFSPEMEARFKLMMDNPANARKRPKFLKNLEDMRGKRLRDLPTDQQAIFVRFYDEVNAPNGANYRVIAPEGRLLGFKTNKDGSLGNIRMNGFDNIAKAIAMIKDPSKENISLRLGDRHKVRSFYNNILNPMSDRGDVTIDTHAVAAGLLQPLGGSAPEVSHNLGTAGDTSSITGVMGSYGIFADAYREAALEVGILPREMQSITWEAIRGLYSPTFKTQKNNKRVKGIWKKYDKGTISIDEARGEIYEIARGIDRAAWEGNAEQTSIRSDEQRDGAGLDQNEFSGNPRGLRGSGLSGGRRTSGRRIDGQSAGVLPPSSERQNVTANSPIGQALADVLGADRQYAPASRISGSRPATPTEVEEQLQIVERLISEGAPLEIGKQGGALENGIQSLQAIKRIAEALNVSFVMAKNMTDLREYYGSPKSTALGFYASRTVPTSLDKQTPDDNRIVVLSPGAKDSQNETVSLGSATFTAAHELGHALSRVRMMGGLQPAQIMNQRKLNTGKLTKDIQDEAFTNSFEGEISSLINRRFGKNPDTAKAMLDELVALQRQGVVSVLEGSPAIVRAGYNDIFKLVEEQAMRAGLTQDRAAEMIRSNPNIAKVPKDSTDSYENYTQRAAELAADLVAVYLIDPNFMKQVAPKSAQFARVYLNTADTSKVVKFFSAPFAAIVAAIAANLAVVEKEDEEEQQRGILSLQRGALSA